MSSKTDEENRAPGLMVRLPKALFEDFQRVAAANDTTPQDMLRLAARAIVRCHDTLKRVPKDMQIVQQPIGSVLASASEEQLGEIIQERLKHSKWEVNEAGALAADLAAEIARRSEGEFPAKHKKKG